MNVVIGAFAIIRGVWRFFRQTSLLLMAIVDSEQMTPEDYGVFIGMEPKDIKLWREVMQNQLDN